MKIPKTLYDVLPISANGVRLKQGDIVTFVDKDKVCSCKVCTSVKQMSVIKVAKTQDEDVWLHAKECNGGEHPLIRLTKPDGSYTSCCFRVNNINFVSRDGCRDKPSNLRIEISMTEEKPTYNQASRTLFKQPDESYADFGRRIAKAIQIVEMDIEKPL